MISLRHHQLHGNLSRQHETLGINKLILKLRKLSGTTCLFTFTFIFLYLAADFIRVTNSLPVGEYSIKYGDLPDGTRFYISPPLATVLLVITSCSTVGSYFFWSYLSRLSNKKAALVAMIPVLLLTVSITVLKILEGSNA